MVSPPFEKTPADAGPPRWTLRCPFRGHISLAFEGEHLGMSTQVTRLASHQATLDVWYQYLSEVTEWQARSVYKEARHHGARAVPTRARDLLVVPEVATERPGGRMLREIMKETDVGALERAEPLPSRAPPAWWSARIARRGRPALDPPGLRPGAPRCAPRPGPG